MQTVILDGLVGFSLLVFWFLHSFLIFRRTLNDQALKQSFFDITVHTHTKRRNFYRILGSTEEAAQQ